MTQILRLDNPLFRPGLTLAQRFNYFNAAAHFLFGVPRLVYLIAPSLFLLFGLHPLNADVRQVLIYALPHLFLVAACTASVNRNTRYSFWPEVYETSIAWYTSWVTTVALFMPRYGSFNVTPKGGRVDRAEFDWRSARPMLVLYALSLASLFVSPWRVASAPAHWDTIVVAAVWNVYNLVVLSAALTVAIERPQRRKFDRIQVDAMPVKIERRAVLIEPVPLEAALEPTPQRLRMLAAVGTGALAQRDTPWVSPPPPPKIPTVLRSGVAAPARNVPNAPPRRALLLDLSEGGARVSMETHTALPELTRLKLTTPSGEVLTLDARVVSQREEGDEERLVAGLSFEDVTPQQRILLIQTMFSEPTRWTRERFLEDSPLRSALDVLVAPFRAMYHHVRGRNPKIEHRGEHLTAFSDTRACHTCGTQQLAVLQVCNHCDALMPFEEPTEPGAVQRSIGQRFGGLFRGFTALPLIALAIVLAVGWKPVVDPLHGQLEQINEARVTPSRVGELAAAHRQLRTLHRQLKWAMLPMAPQLPLDWSMRLWSARYGGELDRRDDPEFYEVVVLLDEAALALESAGRAYRDHQGMAEVPVLADKAAERMDHASRMLATAIREQGEL